MRVYSPHAGINTNLIKWFALNYYYYYLVEFSLRYRIRSFYAYTVFTYYNIIFYKKNYYCFNNISVDVYYSCSLKKKKKYILVNNKLHYILY